MLKILVGRVFGGKLQQFDLRDLTLGSLINYLRFRIARIFSKDAIDPHLRFYRRHLKNLALTNPEIAVGSSSHDDWLTMGDYQFQYLVRQGLKPEHHFLDLGCGNLRLGWRLINYLECGKYCGLDISPEMILQAQRTLKNYNLESKNPRLVCLKSMNFDFLPVESFDRIYAYSVFTHADAATIRMCFAELKRVLKTNGQFEFTFAESQGQAVNLFSVHFFHQRDFYIQLAQEYGYSIDFPTDWKHLQIRARLQKNNVASKLEVNEGQILRGLEQ